MNIENIKNYTPCQLNKKITYINQFTDDQEFIADCVFVAHNVKFDANLLAEQLFWQGFELRTPHR